MIEIVNGIVDVIQRDILQQREITNTATAGDTELHVTSTLPFPLNSEFALWTDDRTCDNYEICRVCCNDRNSNTLTLFEPVRFGYATANVQPLFEGQTVKFVVSGNPPTFLSYPSISVDCVNTSNSPLTLETYEQSANIDIGIWCDSSNYDKSYRMRSTLANRIEWSLFRTMLPLIKPYLTTHLTENVEPYSNLIKVADPTYVSVIGSNIYIVKNGERYPNAIAKPLGHGAVELSCNVPVSFDIGDAVIVPQVSCFNALVNNTQYSNGKDSAGVMLLAATMSYSLSIARNRTYVPSV